MLGVLFAALALGLGWAACQLFGLGLALAPACGLALLAIVSTWAMALGVPLTPALVGVLAVSLSLAGWRARRHVAWRPDPRIAALLVLAAVLPAALLGVAFAGLDVPPNNHDGIFHVEIVDALRHGVRFDTWYPRGYHAAVASVLGLTPWVDSARGTAEASEGLSVLAPLAVFGLGRALGARSLVAAVAAVILALTYVYPYDYHAWGGWPLGMSVVLAVGVWTAVLTWIDRPNLVLAGLVGVLGGAILLTHGTDVYTVGLGLVVIVAARARRIHLRRLGVHLPLTVGVSLAVAAPYIPLLLDWAGGGGAASVGTTNSEFDTLAPQLQGAGIWIQIGLGALGAASLIDLPVRAGLILIGLCQKGAAITRSIWLVVLGVLIVFAFPNQPLLVERVFAVTFPWLADQRLLQIAAIFASLLAGGGLVAMAEWLGRLRTSTTRHRAQATRRLTVGAALLAAFVAEGSGVSIYKSLVVAATTETSFSSDDRLAMAWLRQNARPGDTLANDSSVDAGIWAPYKTGLEILLPRTALGADQSSRQSVRDNITDLGTLPGPEATACQLGVRYVYYGSRVFADEVHHFPSPTVLAGAADLEEVFRSGDAVVFQTRLACP